MFIIQVISGHFFQAFFRDGIVHGVQYKCIIPQFVCCFSLILIILISFLYYYILFIFVSL